MILAKFYLQGLSFDPIEHVKTVELADIQAVKAALKGLQRAYTNPGETIRIEKGPIVGSFIAYSDCDFSYYVLTETKTND